uniref:Thylakoid lumenal 15.0 kDa protein 2ic n=1 Tax=Rhizophora mucronata TaxID=61149 RepID=A0A2P2KAI7_RHIMU
MIELLCLLLTLPLVLQF